MNSSGENKSSFFPEELTFGWNRVAIPGMARTRTSWGHLATPGEMGGIVNANQLHGLTCLT
ncbi:MAG: hypothetical protein CM1200mP39_18600 [Dehalococcoidia bacterium]|nr:MAG: hypothetical protein CM1200mP39_18600 [Dehalococcoidia bacterium]